MVFATQSPQMPSLPHLLRGAFIRAFFVAIALGASARADVVINEILYRPGTGCTLDIAP